MRWIGLTVIGVFALVGVIVDLASDRTNLSGTVNDSLGALAVIAAALPGTFLPRVRAALWTVAAVAATIETAGELSSDPSASALIGLPVRDLVLLCVSISLWIAIRRRRPGRWYFR
jgi:hypothetical protein